MAHERAAVSAHGRSAPLIPERAREGSSGELAGAVLRRASALPPRCSRPSASSSNRAARRATEAPAGRGAQRGRNRHARDRLGAQPRLHDDVDRGLADAHPRLTIDVDQVGGPEPEAPQREPLARLPADPSQLRRRLHPHADAARGRPARATTSSGGDNLGFFRSGRSCATPAAC